MDEKPTYERYLVRCRGVSPFRTVPGAQVSSHKEHGFAVKELSTRVLAAYSRLIASKQLRSLSSVDLYPPLYLKECMSNVVENIFVPFFVSSQRRTEKREEGISKKKIKYWLIDEWEFEMSLLARADLSKEAVGMIVSCLGAHYGVGFFRTENQGSHGRFELVSIEKVSIAG